MAIAPSRDVAIVVDLSRLVTPGNTVIANVSRTALSEAVRTFGRVAVVEITADPEILVERIIARGRESADEARGRIARSVAFDVPHAACCYAQIDNSGPIDVAKDQLIKILSSSSY